MRKPKMIMICGCDGLWKTTIAEKLSKYYGFPVTHFGPVKSMEEGRDEYFKFLNETDNSCITDRYFDGESVYSHIYRGYKANYTEELVQAIEEKFDLYMFVMMDNAKDVIKRLDIRGEDFLKMEDVQQVLDLYGEFYDNSTVNKKWIVRLGRNSTSDMITEGIIDIINMMGDVI